MIGRQLGRGLVLLQLDHLQFIVAASVAFPGFHPAFAAGIGRPASPFKGVEPVHAVMQVHGKAGAYRKINKEHYGCNRFLHNRVQR